jgi:hypothetical protein
MESHPFPEIPCTRCNRPIDLQTDLNSDENGKAVHEECYITICRARATIKVRHKD